MIVGLSGVVEHIEPNYLVLNVQGVYYNVFITLQTFESVSARDSDKLYLETRYMQKEGPPTLYGFFSKEEAIFFDFLISLRGIGPNSAVQILSHYSDHQLQQIFADNDLRKLKKIPGIGDRKAKQMLLDAETKLKTLLLASPRNIQQEKVKNSLESALESLGYNPSEIEKAKNRIEDSESFSKLEIHEQIKAMLRVI